METAIPLSRLESQPMRVGVLGCGHWGQNLVRNFASLGVLAAVCDPSSKGRQKAAELAPGVPVLERYDAVLADPDIHAVVIATPPRHISRWLRKRSNTARTCLSKSPCASFTPRDVRSTGWRRRPAASSWSATFSNITPPYCACDS